MQELIVPKKLVKNPQNLTEYKLIKDKNSKIGLIASKNLVNQYGIKSEIIKSSYKNLINDHTICYQYNSKNVEPYFKQFLIHIGVSETGNQTTKTTNVNVSSKFREYLDFLKTKTGVIELFHSVLKGAKSNIHVNGKKWCKWCTNGV